MTETAPTELKGPDHVGEQEIWHINTVIYGSPGVGKTRLAATAPRPFFFECDPGGALSIRDYDIRFWPINSMDDIREAWTWLMEHLDEFDTVVVDGLTRLQSLGLDEIVDPSRLELDRRIWGKSGRQMRGIVEGLSTFQKHLVFTLTERLRDDQVSHLKILCPDCTPALASILNRNCRLMGRLYREPYMEEGNRKVNIILQTFHDGRLWAKDTSGLLPHHIIHPNLTEIFEAMMGKEEEGE